MLHNMKYIILTLLSFGMFSCTPEDIFPQKESVELSIDTRLPKDANGYSYFTLYSKESQNIHTIGGSIRINDRVPTAPRAKVEWESNLYWNIKKGDTLATITKTYLNQYTGQFTVVTLPLLISSVNSLVPTINKSSYNSEDGSINTVIAPKWEMRGDTMTVVVRYNNIIKTERIILK